MKHTFIKRSIGLGLSCLMLFSNLNLGYAYEKDPQAEEETQALIPMYSDDYDYKYGVENGYVYFEKYNDKIYIVGCDDTVTAAYIPDTVEGFTVGGVGYEAFYGKNSLKSVRLPEGVSYIDDDAFRNCKSLEKVSLPQSLEEIGHRAFENCESLAEINFPDNLKIIEEEAFYNTALTSVILPDSVESIDTYVFSECSKLEKVVLSEKIKEIPGRAFEGCVNLASITIPEGVTYIGYAAFGDTGIKELYIPAAVEEIDGNVCFGAEQLEKITVAADNQNYTSEGGVLYNKSKTELVICPAKISGVFVVPSTVTTIGYEAFAYSEISGIVFNNGITSIGENAFSRCNNIKEIELPKNLGSLQTDTFFLCDNLEKISIPASVSDIDITAVKYCYNLKELAVDPSNSIYTSKDNMLFNKSMTILFFCPPGVNGAINIPASVREIRPDALSNVDMVNVTEINVDENNDFYSSQDGILYNKDKSVLLNCPKSKYGYVTVPDGVKTIDKSAFENCGKLLGVDLPKSLEVIEQDAFYECVSLTNITIPENVTKIYGWAFAFCENLSLVQFEGNAPELQSRNPDQSDPDYGRPVALRRTDDPTTIYADMIFYGCSPDFKINYLNGNAGWSENWDGYNCYAVDSIVEMPRKTITETSTETTTETTSESTTVTTTETASESTTVTATETASESTTVTSTETASESTTVTTTETVSENSTEITTEDEPAHFVADKDSVYLVPVVENGDDVISSDKIGSQVKIDFNVFQNKGFSYCNGFLTYDPSVIKVVGVAKSENYDGYLTYTDKDGVSKTLFDADELESQINFVPSADDKDYADVGADGVKTCAELGKIKYSCAVMQLNEENEIQEVKEDGTLFSLLFEVLAVGDAQMKTEPVFLSSLGQTENEIKTGDYPSSIKIVEQTEKPDVPYGAANGGEMLSAADSAAILQKVLNSGFKMPVEDVTDDYIMIVDVNADGELTAADAAIVLQKVLNSSFVMPIEAKNK